MAIENNQLSQFESIRVYVLRTLKKIYTPLYLKLAQECWLWLVVCWCFYNYKCIYYVLCLCSMKECVNFPFRNTTLCCIITNTFPGSCYHLLKKKPLPGFGS